MKKTGKVYVVLVNWRNPYDTIECILSLLNQSYKNFQVIVCENGSGDDSLDIFKAWAAGEVSLLLDINSPGGAFSKNKVAGDNNFAEFVDSEKIDDLYRVPSVVSSKSNAKVVFIVSPKNTGFAGGNNQCLCYALDRGDGEFYWILNNDTVAETDSLRLLVEKSKSDDSFGIIGATLYHYYQPSSIQYAAGARANRWLATVNPITDYSFEPVHEFENKIEQRISYISGASMFITHDFISHVGLMSEDYFLYYEELDWIARMPSTMKIGYSSGSKIYHKEGVTIGGKTIGGGRKSLTADYFSSRSRIIFTLKYAPAAIPTVIFAILFGVVRRIFRAEWSNAWVSLSGVYDALFGKVLK